MDPQAAADLWQDTEQDMEDRVDAAEGLLYWLRRGGAVPVVRPQGTGVALDTDTLQRSLRIFLDRYENR